MIVSDFDFLGGNTSSLFGNAKTLTCVMHNTTADGQDQCFEYVKYDYWFAILTLLFIHLPSVNVVATLYGPGKAGMVGVKVSLGMAVVGGICALIGYFLSNPTSSLIGWYFVTLSGGILAMGVFNLSSSSPYIGWLG